MATYLGNWLDDVGWVNADLLIATLGLSGYMLGGDIDDIVAGRRDPTRGEYQIIAAALNERSLEVGRSLRPRASGLETGPG